MNPRTRVPHWADIGETTSTVGIRFLCWVEHGLGRWPFRLCLAPVVLGHWLFNAVARRSSRQYLERLQQAHGVFSRPPGAVRSLHHFAVFAETLLDKLLAGSGRYPLARVRIDNGVMHEQMARGEGGVILTAHIGCLELCQALAGNVPGFHMTVLVHTAHAEKFNRMLRRLDEQPRVELLQVTELDAALALQLGQRVANGGFIAIAGDRVPVGGGRSIRSDFLGHPADFPVGPYVLAAALDCALFALACTHEGQGYRLRFECFETRVRLPRAGREAALATHVAHYAAWLEAQLRRAPLDWFNFFPFWDQITHDPASA